MRSRTTYSLLQAILALIGAGIAGFLYHEHVAGQSIPCFEGSMGCDEVNNSHWAYFMGTPVSKIGAIAYIVLLFVAVVKLTSDSEKLYAGLAWFMLLATTGGFIISWIFQYIAKYDIGAFCIYCRASAITMTVMFIVSILDTTATSKRRRQIASPPDSQT